MWECVKCGERHPDEANVCWNCGTTRAGVVDPHFERADEHDPNRPPPGPAPGEAPPAAPPYEFTPAQNALIGELAGAMALVGLAFLVIGAIDCALVLRGDVGALVSGVIWVLVGLWTRSAAHSFRMIVDTRGRDLGHLMTALGELLKLYRFQLALILLAIVLLALFGVLAATGRAGAA